MLTKEQKREQFEQLRGLLSGATTVFLLSNSGLKVREVDELRSKVRGANSTYKVVKNSVVRLAVEGTPMQGLTPFLKGPNALAFTGGDATILAKVLRDFVKVHPALVFERAYLEGHVVDAEEARSVADLPSRNELIARLLFMLQSPLRRLAVALNAPASKLAVALKQIAEKKQPEEGQA
jgi:large subunit ribosomal protein L10